MILLGAVGCLLAVLVVHITYNLYFHPLRDYPGPKLAAATRLPWYRALLGGQISYWTKQLHDQYGPVVRLAPNEISYTTAEAWKDIYSHRPGHILLPKYEGFYNPPPGGVHSILTAPHDQHSRIRRLLSHAFSEKALREQEPLMKVYVDLLIRRLSEEGKDGAVPLDIISWYNWTTFDLFGDLMFGESFDCLKNGNYHPWVGLLFRSIKAQTLFNAASHIPGLVAMLRKLQPRQMTKARMEHMALTIEKVEKRLSQDTERHDFMSYILKHNDEKGMSRPEIRATSFGVIIAGSETTATLLSGTTYHLLHQPEVMKKLVDEVRNSFESESEISLVSVGRLKYMLAVLDEGLRTYPPVPVGLPRRVPPPGEIINGKFVPPGTHVYVNQWATYRSARNFLEPDSFNPERFFGDPRFEVDNKRAFQPFSTGPRNCIGRNLAYAEMRLILARLIWNFDIVPLDTSNNWEKQQMFLLWDKGPLFVRLLPVMRKSETVADSQDVVEG